MSLWQCMGWAALCCSLPAQSLADTHHFTCEVAYLPTRSTWEREVAIEVEQDIPARVVIDGVQAHSFALEGAQLLTAIDNERIVLDMDALSWQSDFRGMASGQGRCSVHKP